MGPQNGSVYRPFDGIFRAINMNAMSPITSRRKASYAPLAIFLHWTLAVLIIGMIPLGWYMLSIEDSPGSEWYFKLHKSIGVVVGTLVLIRLFWRFGHKPNPLPNHLPEWQVKAAKLSHWLLYLTMIAMPLVGIVGASLGKDGLTFFGVTPPGVISPNQGVSEIFFSLHSIIAWVLVGLISLHVVAALKHFINKDGIFQRILPFKSSGREQ